MRLGGVRGILVMAAVLALVGGTTPATGQEASSGIGVQAWTPYTRLSNNDGSSSSPSVAVDAANVHVAWEDDSFGNFEIVYKRSTDGGLTWSGFERISDSSGDSYSPSIAVNGADVHIAWLDYSYGNSEIVYKRSTDGGLTWSGFRRISNSVGNSYGPSIAESGPNVHIAWRDLSYGNSEIVYKHSTDGGLTWSGFRRISNSSGDSYSPSIAVSGATVHIAWVDPFGAPQIVHKRSTDGGVTWSAYEKISSSPGLSRGPTIGVSGATVHVAWYDDSFGLGNNEIVYKHSSDAGITWSGFQRISSNVGFSFEPSVAVSGANVSVAWADTSFGDYEIVYKASTDAGVTWSGHDRLTSNPGLSQYPAVAMSGADVHIAWQDDSFGNYEIVYKRTAG